VLSPERTAYDMSTSLVSPDRSENNAASIPNGRIPALDGWRGIAILLVLVDHLQDALLGHYLRPWTQTGGHGVTIFFVLSGFLITSNLSRGPINLRQFFLKRALRLLPVAWTYLLVLVLLDYFAHTHLSFGLKACLLFYRNFVGQVGVGMTGHFWSLSLEEQFYLAWPPLLLLAGLRLSRWLAVAGALSCAIYRWQHWTYYNHNILSGHTQVRADALLIGCLLALLLSGRVNLPTVQWQRAGTVLAFAVLLFCMARFHGLAPLSENVAIAGLLAATLLRPVRILSARWLTYLGTISYSLYVWQELLMGFYPGWGHVLILCTMLPLLTLSSYYLIERPCTRFGRMISS
jgi:peptidoglycan/LPS O-acetylase OafA/YrhL